MFSFISRYTPHPRFAIRATALVLFFFIVLLFCLHEQQDGLPSTPDLGFTEESAPPHPIDDLIREAKEQWQYLLSNESRDVAAAAQAYRTRRGRHPPPGFDEWFKYAKAHNAVIVEDFFDQIYDDLNPYWGLEPKELRQQTTSINTRVVVRNRLATMVTDEPRDWMTSWHGLVKTIQKHLPDMDIPINVMDESRIIVPFNTLRGYLQKERDSRILPPPADVVKDYMSLSDTPEPSTSDFDPAWKRNGPFWDIAREGCPDDSSARHSRMPLIDFARPPLELYSYLDYSYHGYVRNWTRSKDVCNRPEMQVLHGSFIEPISISTSNKLFPFFGGSKLSMNNEILLPPAMYWMENEMYSGGEREHGGPWERKADRLIWRGAATGGRNREETWTGFQRHRFLAMMNGTTLREVESSTTGPMNFALPNASIYDLRSVQDGRLADFVQGFSDVGFVHLVCSPYDANNPACPYTGNYFAVTKGLPMKAQYSSKYLPDIDGNSFSGRFRGFLLSTSLPIKATIYNEWHDSRLIPWAHFVPMDSTFMDIYGIMEYFLGSKDRGHDSAARQIALDGKRWSELVLRKEDMQIYTYRLLLEFARICNDKRERLGYVGDLMN